jgi:hypothetical protein
MWQAIVCYGQFDGQCDHHTTPNPYVRRVLRKYLEFGKCWTTWDLTRSPAYISGAWAFNLGWL